VYDLKDLV